MQVREDWRYTSCALEVVLPWLIGAAPHTNTYLVGKNALMVSMVPLLGSGGMKQGVCYATTVMSKSSSVRMSS